MATGHEQLEGGGAREEARGPSVPLGRVPGCLSLAADGLATGPLAARH